MLSECVTDSHCPADKPACNPLTSTCVGKLLLEIMVSSNITVQFVSKNFLSANKVNE